MANKFIWKRDDETSNSFESKAFFRINFEDSIGCRGVKNAGISTLVATLWMTLLAFVLMAFYLLHFEVNEKQWRILKGFEKEWNK